MPFAGTFDGEVEALDGHHVLAHGILGNNNVDSCFTAQLPPLASCPPKNCVKQGRSALNHSNCQAISLQSIVTSARSDVVFDLIPLVSFATDNAQSAIAGMYPASGESGANDWKTSRPGRGGAEIL
ncbi:hypothetical protein B0A49_01759 [Cryomyces minteri]|uniref:Uncharacterized protein n=1 Tax=Cryomyces minteri TaxID=331657 RepID=A0A4V5NHW8_9PEZI|nr:hypothetical protein B0A49_01759 [Cryomyces minteri]